MNIREIDLSQIDWRDRLREVDEDKAQMIAASMRDVGEQLTPIEVRKPAEGQDTYKLIAGAHRVRACQINADEHGGRPTIFANIVNVLDDDDALLREIDENLTRAELTPLDRATFLAERKRLYLKMHPETGHGGKRTKASRSDCDLLPLRFSEATAQRLGMSERTVQIACSLYEKLHPDCRRRLVGTPFADNQKELLLLAEQLPDFQLEILELLVGSNKRFPSVRAAIEELDGGAERAGAKTPDERHYEAFTALWSRCSDITQQRIAVYVKQNARRKGGRAAP